MSVSDSIGHNEAQPDSHNSVSDFRGDNSTDKSHPDAAESDGSEWLPSDRRAALAKLKRLASALPLLRKEAIVNEMRARQKRRELGFKRNDVSASVDGFTRELQKLQAERQLDTFPQLLKLAKDFQHTRDIMGPIEADYNDIEQEVEGVFSELQLAEESLYEYLDAFLQSKDVHLQDLPSVLSSHHGLSSVNSNSQYPESQYTDSHHDVTYQPLPPEDPLALEELLPDSTIDVEQSDEMGETVVEPNTTDPDAYIDRSTKSGPRSTGYSYYSASALNSGIDRPLASVPEPIFHIPTVPYQYKPLYDIENYPKLLLDFTTVRDRVTRWLLHSLLVSRWEAEHLKCRLDAENPKAPSNWAQLVLTWWAIDAATAPDTRKHQDQDAPSRQIDSSAFVAILFEQKDLASLLQKGPRTLGAHIFTEVFRNLLDGFFTALSQEAQDKTTIAAVRTFQDTKVQIVELVRERLYGGEPGSIALVVDTKGNDPNRHIDSRSEFATADEHSSLFPDATPKDLPTPAPDNSIWAHVKQSEKSGLVNTFPQRENINSTEDAYETSKISLREDAKVINLIPKEDDTGNVERRYDKSDHDGYSTSTDYVKDFVLKSAAFAIFQHNLAELWKEQMDKIRDPVDCERPPTPKVEKGETISGNAVHPEIPAEDNTMPVQELQNAGRSSQLEPSTEDIKPMTITKAPDLEFDGPARSAVVRSPSSQDSRPHLPSSKHSEPLTIRSRNGTAVPATSDRKANGKTRSNERSHQSEATPVPGSSPRETTPTPSPGKQISEGPTPKIEKNCPAPLNMKEEHLINREREQTRDQRAQNSHESGLETTSTLHNFNFYGILNSPIRTPTGKRIKKTESPSPAQSLTVTQPEGVGQLPGASNKKRVRKSDQDLVPEPASWTRPPLLPVKRHSSRQFEKFEKFKNSSIKGQVEHRYHLRRDFRRGKVFKVWEPKISDREDGIMISARSEKDGDLYSQRVMRFVVIESKPEYCVCFSITSQNGRRTTKDGANIENQAAIYPENQTPPVTPGITRTAIAVKIPYPYHKLEDDSRINYETAYQVEYNVKVCFIGEVSKDSERILVAAYRELHLSPDILRAHSPVPSLSATASTTSGMEPQSPITFSTSGYDGFSLRPGPRSTFSQSSVDSAAPILHNFSQHGDESKQGWEAAQSRGISIPYHSRRPAPSARNQDAYTKRQQNQSPKPELLNNVDLRDDT